MGRGHTPSLSRERPGQRFRGQPAESGEGTRWEGRHREKLQASGSGAPLRCSLRSEARSRPDPEEVAAARAVLGALARVRPPFCPCTHSARSVRPHFQKHGNGSRAATSCPSPRGQPTADGSYSQVHLPLRPRTILCPVTILQMRGPAGERVLSGNTPWARCGWGQWLSQAPGSPGSQGQTPQLWGGAEVSAQEPGSPTQVETAFKQ